MSRTINWTAEKLKVLKAGYDAKVGPGLARTTETFKVTLPDEREPVEFVVSYAKHLIDYLEVEFARNPPRDYGEYREGEEGQ